MSIEVLQGDSLTVLKTLPDCSVHMVVTSPPYWALRDYGVAGQLGLEPIHDCLGWATGARCGECYICHMVEVFREVRRVLRDDGTCWVNEGDSYSSQGGTGRQGSTSQRVVRANVQEQVREASQRPAPGLKPKDLCMIPFRLALAMQADGWWLRDVIVWDKPAPMPESVRDRCTKSWEPILMFSKSERYYFDQEAIRETANRQSRGRWPPVRNIRASTRTAGNAHPAGRKNDASRNDSETTGLVRGDGASRNKRNVWRLPPMPTPDAHFATFPLELPETCLRAGTSERGVCSICGAPWIREVGVTPEYQAFKDSERERKGQGNSNGGAMRANNLEALGSTRGTSNKSITSQTVTINWHPSCNCAAAAIPATVLDPFSGAGTTGLACLKNGRSYLGIELSAEYIEIWKTRIGRHMPLFGTANGDLKQADSGPAGRPT